MYLYGIFIQYCTLFHDNESKWRHTRLFQNWLQLSISSWVDLFRIFMTVYLFIWEYKLFNFATVSFTTGIIDQNLSQIIHQFKELHFPFYQVHFFLYHPNVLKICCSPYTLSRFIISVHWPILFSSVLYQSISTWICKTVSKSIFYSLFMFSVRIFNQFFHIMHETLHIVRLLLNTSRYIHSSKQQFPFWSQSSLKISSKLNTLR